MIFEDRGSQMEDRYLRFSFAKAQLEAGAILHPPFAIFKASGGY